MTQICLGTIAVLAFVFLGGGGASASASSLDTTTTLTISPSIVTTGSPVTFTATITGVGGAPPGTVQFDANATGGTLLMIGTASTTPLDATTSKATYTTTSIPAGSYSVTATYTSSDSFNFFGSTSAGEPLTVGAVVIHNTTTTLTATPPSITAGGSVTFTATVAENDGGTTIPTGDVTFHSTTGGTPALLGTATLDGTGTATLTVPGWQAGTYTIEASYAGDTYDHGSGAQITFVVGGGTPTAVQTTTTVTATPNVIRSDQTVQLTASVVQAGTATPPPAGKMVTFTANGVNLGEAPLDASGYAILSKSGWTDGTYTIQADYVGDIYDHSSSGTTQLTVNLALQSATSYTGDTQALSGSPATLSGVLVDASSQAPLAGRLLTLTMGFESCTGSTASTGVASCTITVTESAGAYTVTASFAGDTQYLPSSGTATMTVARAPTSLAYTGDTSAPSGSRATLSATLSDTTLNAPIAGEYVTLSLDGRPESCTATTDATGNASCPVTVSEPAGSYPIDVTFAGTNAYDASSTVATLTVVDTVGTTLAYDGDTQMITGTNATLAATLLDSNSKPVANETVMLTLSGVKQCTPTTDSSGNASCTVAVAEPAGKYTVTAAFAGDPWYQAATPATGSLTVLRADTTLALAPVQPILQGSGGQLSGTLTRTASGAPVAGRTVTLAIGGKSCTGTTDANGVATCSVAPVTAPVGYDPTSVGFAGDSYYNPSSATGSALLYALAPGGGAFVVGDDTANGSVYFWGSQWWKLNMLSSGMDPASFKGFAGNVPQLVCGASWSTGPGNSSQPPAGPLPAYMGVIVSSANTRSDAGISGNIVGVVVVRTDAGYAPNPGHPGTGTVVASFCPSSSGALQPGDSKLSSDDGEHRGNE